MSAAEPSAAPSAAELSAAEPSATEPSAAELRAIQRRARVLERKQKREQRSRQPRLLPSVSDEEHGGEEQEDEDEGAAPLLEVRPSLIPNAGNGLFLCSRVVRAGTTLVEEVAVAIRRQEAKQILNMPEWRGLQPVIQSNGNAFLDIRKLKLYKCNHSASTSPQCNACVTQTGPARLTLTARRDIWRGEEILWEYSPTMQESYFKPVAVPTPRPSDVDRCSETSMETSFLDVSSL